MTTGTTPDFRRAALGAYGEGLAERHLCEQGMVVLDRNWRCPIGEIDLVLRDGDTLVVCEVKTRTSTSHGSPVEAVTAGKVHRLRLLSAAWIAERGVRPEDVRLDMVGILRPVKGAAEIEHVRGIG